jgi:hypothetical protein
MTKLCEDALTDLIAKEAVRDRIYRYCRAVDRGDIEALRGCYWPDGTDNHGAFKGPVENFLSWAAKVIPLTKRSIHQVHNIILDVKPDGIEAESYFTAYDLRPDDKGVLHLWLMMGRYLDRFVERDRDWRILNRLVVFDWVQELQQFDESEEERFGLRQPIGGRFPNDPIYSDSRWQR